MNNYFVYMNSFGPVLCNGVEHRVHGRPNYTHKEAQQVADWLNGKDQSLAAVTDPAVRPRDAR